MDFRKLIISFSSFSFAAFLIRYCGISKLPILENEVKTLQKKNQELRDKVIKNKKSEISILRVKEHLTCIEEALEDLNNYEGNTGEINDLLDRMVTIKDKLENIISKKSSIKTHTNIHDKHKKINFSNTTCEIDEYPKLKLEVEVDPEEEEGEAGDEGEKKLPLLSRILSPLSDDSSIEIINCEEH